MDTGTFPAKVLLTAMKLDGKPLLQTVVHQSDQHLRHPWQAVE